MEGVLIPVLYTGRNDKGRMTGNLKDFSRVTTRHDPLAAHYPAAVRIAATVGSGSVQNKCRLIRSLVRRMRMA